MLWAVVFTEGLRNKTAGEKWSVLEQELREPVGERGRVYKRMQQDLVDYGEIEGSLVVDDAHCRCELTCSGV